MIDKIRNYFKMKSELFRRKYFFAYGTCDKLDGTINGLLDNFTDKLIDDSKILDKSSVSSFDKLEPIMSDEEFKKLGIDINDDECITGIQEFKKELSMDNFKQTKKCNGPVRRLVLKRDIK